MILIVRIAFLLITLIFVENKIYLQETKDGLAVEFYDCVLVSPLYYCRRPEQPIDLIRENDTTSCHLNGGQLHRFSELHSKSINVSTILHHWRSSIERVDQYARFRRDSRGWDGYLCQCIDQSSFGKNCEYRLPKGNTFDQTLEWQLRMREKYPEKVQEHGDIVCYERVGCDSGVLCLDWREICDGVQQCMSGVDEEHCDLLEMNRCNDADEYRCMNGMRIPDQFFLDGEMDCLDWSDELQFKDDENCPVERVSSECDDRVCPPNQWSCGDGQCINDRLAFQKLTWHLECQSRRDQYFMCETHKDTTLWTMPNGRCYVGGEYHASPVVHRNKEQLCEYLLKCALSDSGEESCPCESKSEFCIEPLKRRCPLSLIPYPRGALLTPFTFLFFNRNQIPSDRLPVSVVINGTVRCRYSLINVARKISFGTNFDARQIIDDLFCSPMRNISSQENIQSHQQCHQASESTDKCDEWNPCMSTSRIRDGWINCLNRADELNQTEIEIERSCAHVQRHRFRCSINQPTCLSVTALGDQQDDCQKGFDEVWFGNGQKLMDMRCNDRSKDECSPLRQYIEQSWTSMSNDQIRVERSIAFRFYCDTFWNLASREDEDLEECRQWWLCPDDQWRCHTGQCIDKQWTLDGDWDWADASDEHASLIDQTQSILQTASSHDSSDDRYSVPTSCNQTRPFLCPSPRASRERFSCICVDQIGDQPIDCAGATDESDTLTHCSHSSAMLGLNFQCLSTNTCIPYWLHCLDDFRCPNQSDDEHWCYRQNGTWALSTPADAVCFDGVEIVDGRCDNEADCSFDEDEFMCDQSSLYLRISLPYRDAEEDFARTAEHTLRLPPYPKGAQITLSKSDSPSTTQPIDDISLSSLLPPFWCNRGLAALWRNGSIVCFCPPQYRGDKCQYQTDRLSVHLSLDLSQSIYHRPDTDPTTLLRILVLFVFKNQTLMTHHFHLRTAIDMTFIQKDN